MVHLLQLGFQLVVFFLVRRGEKNVDQALKFGGNAQEAYDVCYHEACDTEMNINATGLTELLGSIVHAVTWAEDVQAFGGRRRAHYDMKKRLNELPMRGCRALK